MTTRWTTGAARCSLEGHLLSISTGFENAPFSTGLETGNQMQGTLKINLHKKRTTHFNLAHGLVAPQLYGERSKCLIAQRNLVRFPAACAESASRSLSTPKIAQHWVTQQRAPATVFCPGECGGDTCAVTGVLTSTTATTQIGCASPFS